MIFKLFISKIFSYISKIFKITLQDLWPRETIKNNEWSWSYAVL